MSAAAPTPQEAPAAPRTPPEASTQCSQDASTRSAPPLEAQALQDAVPQDDALQEVVVQDTLAQDTAPQAPQDITPSSAHALEQAALAWNAFVARHGSFAADLTQWHGPL